MEESTKIVYGKISAPNSFGQISRLGMTDFAKSVDTVVFHNDFWIPRFFSVYVRVVQENNATFFWNDRHKGLIAVNCKFSTLPLRKEGGTSSK